MHTQTKSGNCTTSASESEWVVIGKILGGPPRLGQPPRFARRAVSAVFDRAGTPIAKASKWGTVAVAEVDLVQPFVGPYNLGDFRSMVQRHRP